MQCRLYVWNIVAFGLVFVTSEISGYTEDSELAKVVNELQSQVLALQNARSEDRARIKTLQDKLWSHLGVDSTSTVDSLQMTETVDYTDKPPTIGDAVVSRVIESSKSNKLGNVAFSSIEFLERERTSLSLLDNQLRQLKSDLAEVVKIREREITVTEDVAEFRLEADSMRDEILKVKRDLEEVKAKRDQDVQEAKQSRTNQVTTKWLQKTVENLRREMAELASSVNVTASLGQQQRDEMKLDLAKSDRSDLRKRLDSLHVFQERDSAWISQLKLDVAELRTKTQNMVVDHQKLIHEVQEIKVEMRDRDISISRQTRSIGTENRDSKSHNHRHRRHWKEEADELRKETEELKLYENTLRYEVRQLKNSNEDLNTKVANLEHQSFQLMEKSTNMDVEQRGMQRDMDAIKQEAGTMELSTDYLRSTVKNITETGIKKLHASTIQLFESLEAIENNYDHTITDMRKEMSKIEFGLAQAQSTIDELREDQSAYEHSLKSMKNDARKVQMEAKKDHFRFLTLKTEVLNHTLQESKSLNGEALQEMKMSDLESKIAMLSRAVDGEKVEVDELHKLVAEKADNSDLSRWERTQDRLREIVLNITETIPRLNKEEEALHDEMEKFVKQLPKDCSAIKKSNVKAISGSYLVQSPVLVSTEHPKAVRVSCDMETVNGGWTLIQRRKDGRQIFNQNWVQYKEGFGDVESDFWLGNELIHRLTTVDDYVLRIDLWDAAGRYKFVEYDTFKVLQESDGYRLAVGGYKGNASDAMGYHNGMAFSTPDRDNDGSMATHCGEFYGSGWWYNHCQYVNINGRYSTGVTWYDIDAQEWSELMRVEMKIKPRRMH